ncbi:MAG: hypothetical protein WA970_04055 [Gammaproteobacteria bacterium]
MDWNDKLAIPYGAIPVLAMLLSPLTASHAAEWYLDPSISLIGRYDDNRFLRTTNEASVLGGQVSPTLAFGRRTETTDIRGVGQVDGIITNDERDPDRIEALARFFTDYQTQLSRWQFDAYWRRETTLRTDIRDPSFDAVEAPSSADLQSPDLGLITNASLFFNRFTVEPSAQWVVGPRTTLELEYRFDYLAYEDEQEAELFGVFNSMRNAIVPSLAYRLSPTTSLRFIGRYQRYDNDNDDYFNNYSIGLGIDHAFSESAKVSLTAGPTYTESEQGDDLGAVVDASLEQQFEKSRLATFLRYDIEPTTRGIPLQRTQFDVRWFRDLTPRWAFEFLGRAFRNDRLDDVTSGDDRYYAQVEPVIVWRATRLLFLEARYRFRWERRDDTDDDAFSNGVELALTYRWDRISASR